MLKELISPVFVILNQLIFAQSITPEVLCTLPNELSENSGMIAVNDSILLMHNDSGHEPCIYVIDDKCQIINICCLTNATNVDWEDIAIDSEGFVYIADLGNNNNKRQTASIYKVHSDSILNHKSTSSEKIQIAFSGNFPPSNMQLMYDIESLYWFNDSLFFLSKNRRKPFDGVSWVFAVPSEGNTQHSIQPIDSIIVPSKSRYSGWITAADYEASSNILLLLGQDQLTALTHNDSTPPYQGKQTTFTLPFLSQKEAITFGNAFVFLSDEAFKGVAGQQLYRFPKKLLYELLELNIHLLPINYGVKIVEKKISKEVVVTFTLPYDVDVAIEIFNTEGRRVLVKKQEQKRKGMHRMKIDVSKLFPAPYVINVIIDNEPNALIFQRERGDDEPIIPR